MRTRRFLLAEFGGLIALLVSHTGMAQQSFELEQLKLRLDRQPFCSSVVNFVVADIAEKLSTPSIICQQLPLQIGMDMNPDNKVVCKPSPPRPEQGFRLDFPYMVIMVEGNCTRRTLLY